MNSSSQSTFYSTIIKKMNLKVPVQLSEPCSEVLQQFLFDGVELSGELLEFRFTQVLSSQLRHSPIHQESQLIIRLDNATQIVTRLNLCGITGTTFRHRNFLQLNYGSTDPFFFLLSSEENNSVFLCMKLKKVLFEIDKYQTNFDS